MLVSTVSLSAPWLKCSLNPSRFVSSVRGPLYPAEDLQAAIQLGIAKVNFNTELRQAYFGEFQRHLDEAARLDLLALMERTSQAMEGVMRQKIAIVSQR